MNLMSSWGPPVSFGPTFYILVLIGQRHLHHVTSISFRSSRVTFVILDMLKSSDRGNQRNSQSQSSPGKMSPFKIPILLLKTKSLPNDSYEEYFSKSNLPFTPVFVPVLKHRSNAQNLGTVKGWLRDGQLREKYGGMIFTSQRAVEAFAGVVEELGKEVGAMAEKSKSGRTPVAFQYHEIGHISSRIHMELLYFPSSLSVSIQIFRCPCSTTPLWP